MTKLRFLFLLTLIGAISAYAQIPINFFNAPRADTLLWKTVEGAPSSITLQMDTVDKVQGQASLKVHARIGALHGWGSFAQFGYSLPDTVSPWDYSISDSLSIWIKVNMPASVPANILLRIQLADKPSKNDPKEQWIYQTSSILTKASAGWVHLMIPLVERASDGSTAPDSTGFVYAPTNWGGLTWNDKKFNRDKIVEWNIGIITSGWDPAANLPADSVDVAFAKYERVGTRAVPVVIFNGLTFPSNVVTAASPFPWGNSSTEIVKGAGVTSKYNALKWIQGDQWNNGWTGWTLDFVGPTNLAGGWQKDSLKFKMKCDTGTAPIRAQFETATAKKGMVFTPIADGAWHSYALSLAAFVPQDGTTGFDSTVITKFGFMAEGNAKVGKTIYMTDIWTGSPEFDVIPPDAPTAVAAVGSSYTNLVTWNQVTSEPGVIYNVFYSTKPWTSSDSTFVEDLPPYKLPATTTLATHYLIAPDKDQNVTYYYGVVAQDPAGNLSTAGVMTTPVTTLAKGVPTIALNPVGFNFKADGSLTDWSAVKPFSLNTQKGTAHGVPNFVPTDSADLSGKVWLAMDATNLYVAIDVVDNVVVVDTTAANDYEQDSPDVFIGLYDWVGKHHSGYGRGATPDYHLRFSKNRVKTDNGGKILMYNIAGNANYYWKAKPLSPGYIVEAKIPFTMLTDAFGDNAFTPKAGMRIPIDFAVNDRDDAAVATRHAIMCYSSLSDDKSWSDQFYWSNTWIGSGSNAVQKLDDVAYAYELSKNYPNPFNPSTQIKYSIARAGNVSLKVFDLIGREIATLVDGYQDAGKYAVSFNSSETGRTLASGVYFYRLEAGSFVSVNKMMLVK